MLIICNRYVSEEKVDFVKSPEEKLLKFTDKVDSIKFVKVIVWYVGDKWSMLYITFLYLSNARET